MKLFIKNMVSIRCKMVVKEILVEQRLHFIFVELGEVEVLEDLTTEERQQLRDALRAEDFDLLDDRKAMLVEKIKTVIVQMVHHDSELPRTNFSVYLSEKLNHDYTYLSNLFSTVKGVTIEHFIIAHKIESVKEHLIYDELTLTQIAEKLGYSSVSHLSNQFKKVTGLTPSAFKKMKEKNLVGIENL